MASDAAYSKLGAVADGEEGSADVAKKSTQSRVATVASLVNTMMGTTIVAIPYGLSQSGMGSGLLIIAVLGACSCYTALILARAASSPGEEFSATVAKYMGVRVQLVAWAISLAIIAGAAIVYHILMQETLYALVLTVAQGLGYTLSQTQWRREYAAIIPWILYPVSNLKDMSALVKFNSTGVFFLWYTILFMWAHGARALAATGAASPIIATALPAADGSAFAPDGALRMVLGGSDAIAGLGGMMMLSFFLHNCFQPIVKSANPDTINTDMGIAYTIAGALYSAVGVLGYAGYADAQSPASCAWNPSTASSTSCVLSSNFLAMFGTGLGDSWSVYALSARISLLLQLFTVFPLLLLIIRVQVWGYVSNTPWPGLPRVAGLNFLVMAATFAFAAVDAKVSEVLRFVGAVGGLVIVYAVPLAIHVAQRRLGAAAKEGSEVRTGSFLESEDVRAGLMASSLDGRSRSSGSKGEDGGELGYVQPAAVGSVGRPVPLPPSLAADALDACVMLVGASFFCLQFVPALGGS
jgi:sodium-coupled neutral amino acid transporter 9